MWLYYYTKTLRFTIYKKQDTYIPVIKRPTYCLGSNKYDIGELYCKYNACMRNVSQKYFTLV